MKLIDYWNINGSEVNISFHIDKDRYTLKGYFSGCYSDTHFNEKIKSEIVIQIVEGFMLIECMKKKQELEEIIVNRKDRKV